MHLFKIFNQFFHTQRHSLEFKTSKGNDNEIYYNKLQKQHTFTEINRNPLASTPEQSHENHIKLNTICQKK